jgi:eukaryotic-like serine/threonine-protein kinase
MGARLGRYVVLKHLATGGMADVLLGRSDGIEGFERHVVLKRIRPEHARDQRFIRMFLDEARVAANLHHQHVVQVHDIGEAAGEYFIAMEYIHGEDVRTILSNASKNRAHVPLGVAVAIVSAAAAGLHYAHERRGSDKRPLGIVHRDVSPSNILVGYDGSIKVVDFGIAKATMRQETRSGGLKGKVSYMSPEQCKSDDIDRRSDVYSLGVVLYELATTTRLFKGDNDYLVMDQIVNGRVSLPRVRRPDLPNELSAIIMRALAPDPERRYFTADELRVALDQFANRAGLTASTSQIAHYMRKQFGEKPEPWSDIGHHVVGSLDDAKTSIGEVRPNAWIEVSRGDEGRRSSGAIPRTSGPIPISVAASEVASSETSPRELAERASIVRLPTATPPPTDSKMAWESQKPARMPRGLTPTRVAMICAPLIVILGIAIWRLAGTGNTGVPVLVQQPPPAVAAAAPVVTPIPDPARPAAAATAPAQIAPDAVVATASPNPQLKAPPPSQRDNDRTVEPPPRRAQATPAKRAPAAKGVDTASKADAQGASAVQGPTPPAPSVAAAVTPPASAPAAAQPPASAPAAAAAPPAPAATPAPAPAAVAAPPPVVEIGLPQLGHALIERVASDHSRELSKCDGNEELHGDITVKFMIDGSGKVSKAQVATAIKKPKVIACILRVLQRWQFPKQGPGGAQGTYTLSFQ